MRRHFWSKERLYLPQWAQSKLVLGRKKPKGGVCPLPPPGDQRETTVECRSLAWMVDFPGEIVKLSSSLALSGGLLKHRLASLIVTTWSKLLWYYLIISSSWPECLLRANEANKAFPLTALKQSYKLGNESTAALQNSQMRKLSGVWGARAYRNGNTHTRKYWTCMHLCKLHTEIDTKNKARFPPYIYTCID